MPTATPYPSFDRGDILALFDDGPLPTCTAAEEQKISARIDALLAKERACKRGKPEGTCLSPTAKPPPVDSGRD